MKRLHKSGLALLLGASLALTACGGNQTGGTDRQPDTTKAPLGMQTQNGGNTDHLTHPGVIPSYDGPKTATTNEYGKTNGGMGTSVYSLIGSSSLHEGGISSHVQSRLAGQGIDGVKVFVLDDTVILAREEQTTASNQYDELQLKVLSPTEGLSGKGAVQEGKATRPNAKNEFPTDSMEQAKQLVQAMFDGQVRILTVTNPQATDLMDRITSSLRSSPPSTDAVVKDLATLLQMTKESGQ